MSGGIGFKTYNKMVGVRILDRSNLPANYIPFVFSIGSTVQDARKSIMGCRMRVYVPVSEMEEAADWANDNCVSWWTIATQQRKGKFTFYFSHTNDAVHFKLRWA